MNQMNSKSTLNFWEKQFFVWVNNLIYSYILTQFLRKVCKLIATQEISTSLSIYIGSDILSIQEFCFLLLLQRQE